MFSKVMVHISNQSQIDLKQLEKKGIVKFQKGNNIAFEIQPAKASRVEYEDILSLEIVKKYGSLNPNRIVIEDTDSKEVMLALHLLQTGISQGWLLLYFNEFNKYGPLNIEKAFHAIAQEDIVAKALAKLDGQSFAKLRQNEILHMKNMQSMGNFKNKIPDADDILFRR